MTVEFEHLPNVLGMPFYQTANVQIYCTESLAALDRLPENLLALTVTSPPYNIGKEYEQVVEQEKYLQWCEEWVNKVYRCTSAAGAFWLNLGYFEWPERAKAIPIAYCLWRRIPFFLLQEVIWHYGAGVSTKRMLCPRNEKFLFYVKDQERYTFNLDAIRDPDVKYPTQKKNGKFKCNPLGKNPGDVWYIPKVTSGENRASKKRTPHPAPFPLAPIERVVKVSSNHSDLVMYPFMGSGTTALASIRNGRKFIGFEIREDYCRIAADRLEQFQSQSTLAFAVPE